MKKFLFTFLAVATFGATQASAMSYHDNDIQFPQDLKLVSYEIKASCVTDGQDPKGDISAGKFAKIEGSNNDQFMFHCGRKKSSKVGDWIKTCINFDEASFAQEDVWRFPNKANFATIGKMTVVYNGTSYVFENILFAQYSSSSSNFWIIGQVGAITLGVLPVHSDTENFKCASLYAESFLGYKGNRDVTSELSVPVCGQGGSSYKFVDTISTICENYSPVEEIVHS